MRYLCVWYFISSPVLNLIWRALSIHCTFTHLCVMLSCSALSHQVDSLTLLPLSLQLLLHAAVHLSDLSHCTLSWCNVVCLSCSHSISIFQWASCCWIPYSSTPSVSLSTLIPFNISNLFVVCLCVGGMIISITLQQNQSYDVDFSGVCVRVCECVCLCVCLCGECGEVWVR